MTNKTEIDEKVVDAAMEFNKPVDEIKTVTEYASELDPDTEVVVPLEQSLQQVAQQSPMIQQTQQDRFVEMALQSGDMEKLEKMLELKERFDREEARKSFTSAMARFKSEGVEIKKDRTVSFENNDKSVTSYTHASLGNVVKMAVPALAAHGLSHRWDVVQEVNAPIKVTCVMTHEGGHSESITMQAAADTSGKKNSIQQAASTITYLERYTFLAITGLAVEEQDDDGLSAAPAINVITEEQSLTLNSRITDNDLNAELFTGWLGKKCPYTNGSIDKLSVENYDMVLAKIDATIKQKQAKEAQE